MWISFLLGLIIISLTIGCWYSYNIFIAKSAISRNCLFVVDRGSNITTISQNLYDKKLISNKRVFKYGAILMGDARVLIAGEYNIPAHSSMVDILSILKSGKCYHHSFSVPEGLTVLQIAEKMKQEKALSGNIPSPLPKEGSLMPTTLKFLRGTKRQELFKRLEVEQKKLVDSIWENRDKKIPLKNKKELVILASIIEKETGFPKERPMVASVFYNRIHKHIKLQADSTVIYGIYGGAGKPTNYSLSHNDLENDNQYNTYKIQGLPIEPIANPGHEALLAAAHPAKSNYLYFVVGKDGKHVFSTNLAQHNKAVSELRSFKNHKNIGK